MSSSRKSKSRSFRSDVHRRLVAEAAQKPGILTRSSGHPEPRRLNRPLRRTTQSGEETQDLLTAEQTRTKQRIVLASVKQKEFCSKDSKVRMSKQGPVPDCSSLRGEDVSLPEIVHRLSASSQPNVSSQNRSSSLSDPGNKQPHSSQSVQKVLSDEGELKVEQRFGRKVVTRRCFRAGSNVAELHERKLQEELEKLPAPSGPGRDRLVVFSDVFDDVCEGSPVFGRILREIKTDYDSYIEHMTASQPSLLDAPTGPPAQPPKKDQRNQRTKGNDSRNSPTRTGSKIRPKNPTNTSVKHLGTDGVSEAELEEAEKEVYLLEEEARGALAEKKRVQSESQNVPALAGPEDTDTESKSSAMERKRLQVLNTWREVQHLEEELRDKLVPTATTTATERRVAAVKVLGDKLTPSYLTEIMRLIASNNCLKTASETLENNINMVLDREKAGKNVRRMLWDGISCDLPTERSTS